MDPGTRAFYDRDPEGYASTTFGGDVSPIRARFVRLLNPGARILDLGCGSGRDTLDFIGEGFDVTAVDGSGGMCRVASERIGLRVRNVDFTELDYGSEFDGVWACASLLHLRPGELPHVLSLIRAALVDGGVLYMSFKRGRFSGMRDGRWYTDMDPEGTVGLAEGAGFSTVDVWESTDPRGTVWVNGIFRKIRRRTSKAYPWSSRGSDAWRWTVLRTVPACVP